MFELFSKQNVVGEHYELKLKNNDSGSNISKYFLKSIGFWLPIT